MMNPNHVKILLNIRNFNQDRTTNDNISYYRPNNTFKNIHSDYVMVNPLVKITNASITSPTVFVESGGFNKLISNMKSQSNTYDEDIYYNNDKTITYNKNDNTIIEKPSLWGAPVIYDFDNSNNHYVNTSTTYFIKNKNNTIQQDTGSTVATFTKKTLTELLVDATKNGTVSNNMKITMNQLFAPNSQFFLNSSASELTIYKQTQSSWELNLNNYESSYKEKCTKFKKILDETDFTDLKSQVIYTLTTWYANATNQTNYTDFYTTYFLAKVNPEAVKEIDKIVNRFLDLNISNTIFKTFLQNEYENMKKLDEQDIPVECRFNNCPKFYVYSFKWNNEAYIAAGGAPIVRTIGSVAASVPGSGSVGQAVPGSVGQAVPGAVPVAAVRPVAVPNNSNIEAYIRTNEGELIGKLKGQKAKLDLHTIFEEIIEYYQDNGTKITKFPPANTEEFITNIDTIKKKNR